MTPQSMFSVVGLIALAGWLLLAASIVLRRPLWRDLIAGRILPLSLSVFYAVLIMAFWGRREGGFDSLAQVQRLFGSPWLLLAGWVHYLAFDLFVGAHIARSSADLGLPRWPLILLLPLTFLFGPLGLLGFEITKLLLRQVDGGTVASQLLHTIRCGSPLLWPSIVAMALFALVCVGLMQFDDRLIQGVSVWQKPAKFFLSLAVQFATIGWALSYLPETERRSRRLRSIIGLMLAAGWTEQAYIIFRAARAEASHFNIGDTTSVLLYGLMGLGALILTATMLEVGRRLWRQRHRGLMAEAGGLGLMLGAVLATAGGGYLSAQQGHWGGGVADDSTGIGFFSWSTSGGDLRVAHFIGLHVAQLLPLAALSGRRSVVITVAVLTTLACVATFVQAVLGIPLLRL